MTKEELDKKLIALTSKYEGDRTAIYSEYIESNNPHKIGDVVQDHIGKVKVESMSAAFVIGRNDPVAVYYGTELKMNGEPKKSGEKRRVFQSNLV